MNILVTGGCGFIGLHLTKLLDMKKKYNIVIYDNLKEGTSYLNNFGRVYKGELNDSYKLQYLFKKYNFKCIIHLAGLAHISDSFKNPKLYYHNNLISSINLLDICIKFNIKFFLFSSSCTVYGDKLLKKDENHIFTEEDNIEPISPYGNTKMCFEYILKDYSNKYNFNYTILRYFNACGSDPSYDIGEFHKDEKRIIPRLIKSCINETKVFINGDKFNTKDGTCVRDYTHVCDIASSHIKAIEYMFNNNKNIICNIGSGVGYSIKELISKIEKISGKAINFEIREPRIGDASKMICSNKRAINILKWEPKFDIDDIIKTSYEWYKDILPTIEHKLSSQKYFNILNENEEEFINETK
jgi:UDP-glucose 4-epimerase